MIDDAPQLIPLLPKSECVCSKKKPANATTQSYISCFYLTRLKNKERIRKKIFRFCSREIFFIKFSNLVVSKRKTIFKSLFDGI